MLTPFLFSERGENQIPSENPGSVQKIHPALVDRIWRLEIVEMRETSGESSSGENEPQAKNIIYLFFMKGTRV